MTLILSCLTANYAIQISDRRLTLPNGTIHDDHSNKAILVNGLTIFGYTGLAYMDNRNTTKTDEWFLSMFNEAYKAHPDVSFTTTAEYIAKRATEVVYHLNTTPELSRLAFVGVGWSKPPGKDELYPVYTIISNAHDEHGQWLATAQSQFSVLHFSPPNDMPVMLVSDGQPLNREYRKRVVRLLGKCVEKGIGPNTIARILVATVRSVASTNSRVGRNLLVNSIPKASVSIGRLSLFGHSPTPNTMTFAYVPENTSVKIQYGPIVFHYGTLIQGMIAYQDAESGHNVK